MSDTIPSLPATIEAQFAQQQDAHTAGFHSWENAAPYQFPEKTYRELNEVAAADIPKALLEKPDMAIHSVSQLPSRKSEIAMQPYGLTNPRKLPTPAYLFNMDPGQVHGPRILITSLIPLESGMDTHAKRLDPEQHRCTLPGLENIYDYFPTEREIKTALAGENGAMLSQMQQTKLGLAMENVKRDNPWLLNNGVIGYNEQLAAVSFAHVNAIIIPTYNDTMGLKPKRFRAALELIGAIAGLQHLAHEPPIDLPVMMYAMNGPNIGKMNFLGQGKQQFETIAHNAIARLEQDGAFREDCSLYSATEREALAHAVQQLLHIDITQPLPSQHVINGHSTGNETRAQGNAI